VALFVYAAWRAPHRALLEVWPVGVGLGGLVVVFRAARARLVLHPEGLAVTNPWRRIVIGWEEVELIAWNAFNRGRFGGGRCVVFWLRGRQAGRRIGQRWMPRRPFRPVRSHASVGLSFTGKEELVCVLRNAAALHRIPFDLIAADLRIISPAGRSIPPRP
jgi:hypothetical protein